MTASVRIVGRSIRRWIRARLPEPGTARSELVAGIPGAISSVPDGMASSVLTGVNPVHGLYASIFGPVGGGLSLEHAPDGHHHDQRLGAGGRVGDQRRRCRPIARESCSC